MLHEFISVNREELIASCRAKMAPASLPAPSEAEIECGIPLFLDQLVEALRSGRANVEIDRSARQHGLDLLAQGFTLSQVVHNYGDVCQAIAELAVETNASITADDFRTLHRCLCQAIAVAVTTYENERQARASIKQQEASERSNERVGFLVHELRNLVNTATVAFEVLKIGDAGVSGSTGAVLQRSLLGLRDLIAHSLDEVRMTRGPTNRERIVVAELIQSVAPAARLAANVRGITLTVPPVDHEIAIDGDEQILTAVVGNLLQNATKFTRPNSGVTLCVGTSADRVLIEVADECGGLPGGEDAKELAPPFKQGGTDRSGLGIGLTFSRWGAEVNGGRLYARNLPGKGCVFIVDLPRGSVGPDDRVRPSRGA
jgi:signal transduction histidine kinase